MNTCNKCNSCGGDGPCGCGCKPAKYGCDFDVQANPFDASIWNVVINGAVKRVKIPKINETDTKLSTNYTASSLIYNAEKHTDTITGTQLGSLIKVEDLRDTETANADSCDILVYNPYCSDCGDSCKPKNARWVNYHIPDAGDCEMEPDDDGYYKVLVKNDCGCIKECRMPVSATGAVTLDYQRDSVPDDPDFPWYYGCYNDRINLHLQENFPQFFGKYDLKVTVNYGVQALKSDKFSFNYNWRSLVAPAIDGEPINVEATSSILQNWAAAGSFTQAGSHFPWGSSSLRASFTFIVPKGKEAYLHHEYRIRVAPSDMQYGVPAGQVWPNYLLNSNYDGKRVPDAEATINNILWPASRLNALQVIIEPTMGSANFDPARDAYRNQLDAPDDEYDNPA
jgi:hypothetical protein